MNTEGQMTLAGFLALGSGCHALLVPHGVSTQILLGIVCIASLLWLVIASRAKPTKE